MKRGLTQEGLAEITGVSRQAVAKWEQGETLPELDKLMTLSGYFTLPLDVLVRGEGECTPGKDSPGPVPSGGVWRDFLCRAKRATYASGGGETDSSRSGSRDLEYGEGELYYRDTYLGGERFSGEEALWAGGNPVWSMNYAGRVTGRGFSGDFLKEALRLTDPEAPYRGPVLYVKGDYAYHCRREGTFEWFHGREEILFRERVVFECLFHGGIII